MVGIFIYTTEIVKSGFVSFFPPPQIRFLSTPLNIFLYNSIFRRIGNIQTPHYLLHQKVLSHKMVVLKFYYLGFILSAYPLIAFNVI